MQPEERGVSAARGNQGGPQQEPSWGRRGANAAGRRTEKLQETKGGQQAKDSTEKSTVESRASQYRDRGRIFCLFPFLFFPSIFFPFLSF